MGIEVLLGAMSATSLLASIISIARKYLRASQRQREVISTITNARETLRAALADDDLSPEERDMLRKDLAELNLLVHMGGARRRSQHDFVELNPVDEKSIGAFVDEVQRVETLSRGSRGSAAPVG